MAKKQFSIDITISETLFVEEIWPDGNAPENPTVADVRAAMFGSETRVRKLSNVGVSQVLENWGLLDIGVDDVIITDQTAFVEQMEKLAQRRKEEGL